MSGALEAGVAIYVALAVALAVWVGIFVYLWWLDAQSRELRRRLDQQPAPPDSTISSVTLRQQRADPTAEPRSSGEQEPFSTPS